MRQIEVACSDMSPSLEVPQNVRHSERWIPVTTQKRALHLRRALRARSGRR